MFFSSYRSGILVPLFFAIINSNLLTLKLPSGSDIKLGRHVTFVCQVSGSLAIKQWKKDGNILDLSNSRYQTNKQKSILLINPTLKQDSGSYYCTAQSMNGKDVSSNTVQLNVRVMPTIYPYSDDVREGNLARLGCPGNDMTYVDGSFNGASLYDHPRCSMKGSFGEILEIRKTVIADAGQYKCTAVNQFLTLATSKFPLLRIQYSPIIVGDPVDSTNVEGYDVRMSCNVSADPPAKIYWRKEGRLIDLFSRRFLVQQSDDYKTGNLLITKAQVADSGMYKQHYQPEWNRFSKSKAKS
eukprot:m.115792 g.115792  ORF g.115792 m.115792 type:complete len:298 (+) comp37563_c0_seq17:139-1032(+)